jgi:hypothetical protein
MSYDDDALNTTIDTGSEVELDPNSELDAVLDDLESLLKNGEVISTLTARGINGSLALCAASGLRAYLKGKKREAADDFATVAEEIRGRSAGDGEPRA